MDASLWFPAPNQKLAKAIAGMIVYVIAGGGPYCAGRIFEQNKGLIAVAAQDSHPPTANLSMECLAHRFTAFGRECLRDVGTQMRVAMTATVVAA